MDTLKTAIVVVLLLAVLYGVYVILNKPADQPVSEEIAWHQQQAMEPLDVDLGDFEQGSTSEASSPSIGMPDSSSDSETAVEPPEFAPPPDQIEPETPEEVEAPDLLSSDSTEAEQPEEPQEAENVSAAEAEAGSGSYESIAAQAAQSRGSSSHAPEDEAADETPASDPSEEPPVSQHGDSPTGDSQTDGSQKEHEPAEEDSPEEDPPSEPASVGALGEPAGDPLGSSEHAASFDVQASPPTGAEQHDEMSASSSVPTNPRASSFDPFSSGMESAMEKIEEGDWHDALWTLSMFFSNPDLTDQQHKQLVEWLDPLAAKVVYSKEHLIEPPHEVERGDTLREIAQQYDVPWQLLANINGIETPDVLVPGTELKVVRGPFRVDIDMSRSELTLFAGKLYAGRFVFTAGNEPDPSPGEYQVEDKQPGQTYYAGDGRTIPAGTPSNPYGEVWLGLGGELSIHGSASSEGSSSGLGCISLSPRDARDVYNILSEGSEVLIRR